MPTSHTEIQIQLPLLSRLEHRNLHIESQVESQADVILESNAMILSILRKTKYSDELEYLRKKLEIFSKVNSLTFLKENPDKDASVTDDLIKEIENECKSLRDVVLSLKEKLKYNEEE